MGVGAWAGVSGAWVRGRAAPLGNVRAPRPAASGAACIRALQAEFSCHFPAWWHRGAAGLGLGAGAASKRQAAATAARRPPPGSPPRSLRPAWAINAAQQGAAAAAGCSGRCSSGGCSRAGRGCRRRGGGGCSGSPAAGRDAGAAASIHPRWWQWSASPGMPGLSYGPGGKFLGDDIVATPVPAAAVAERPPVLCGPGGGGLPAAAAAAATSCCLQRTAAQRSGAARAARGAQLHCPATCASRRWHGPGSHGQEACQAAQQGGRRRAHPRGEQPG